MYVLPLVSSFMNINMLPESINARDQMKEIWRNLYLISVLNITCIKYWYKIFIRFDFLKINPEMGSVNVQKTDCFVYCAAK